MRARGGGEKEKGAKQKKRGRRRARRECSASTLLVSNAICTKIGDRFAQAFAFQGVTPNAAPNDLLGEGWNKKKWQESVDRAFFYVWAGKDGTATDARGQLCVEGNRQPAWTNALHKYPVKGAWLDRLLRAYKLSLSTYEKYLFLCRDGVAFRKRSLDLLTARAEEEELKREVQERTKRLRNNPAVYQPFKPVPEAAAWLATFASERMRYPVLLVHAPSHTGKTEWASSLFQKPLELKVGTLKQFPEGMRRFDKSVHDALVLDDVRDLQFVVDHQEKLQGKYTDAIEFATTPGGGCAFWKDLYKVPVVLTVNNTTRNLDFLSTDDFCCKPKNVCFLSFAGRPGEAPPRTSWPLQ